MARGKSNSRALTNAGKLVVTAAIIALIIHRLGLRQIVATVVQADFRFVLGAVFLFFASGVLGVCQWRILLKNKGTSLPFTRAFVLYFVGMFFNNFVFGFIAGDAVKIALVKAHNGDTASSFAATVLDRFAGLMAMAGLAIFGGAILVKRGLLDDGKVFTSVIALAGAFALFCGILLFLTSRRTQRLVFAILAALPLPGKNAVFVMLRKVAFEAGNRRVVLPVAVTSTIVQVMRVGVHILCAASLGLLSQDNFQYFFVFVPILAMLMIIPLPFGVKEGIGGGLFLLAGFSPETPEAPIVMEFLASLVGVAVGLIGGVLFVTSKMRVKPVQKVSV